MMDWHLLNLRMTRLAFFLIVFSTIACAQDLRRAPGPADIDALIAPGFPAARDHLVTILTTAYQPGQMGISGSSGNSTFSSWLDLWHWCDLLSRTGEEETMRLLKRHIYNDKETGRMTFVGPGVEVDLEPISDTQAAELVCNPPDGILEQLLPYGHRPPLGSLSELLSPEIIAEFMKDRVFSKNFFAVISADDYLPLVLENLRDIRLTYPAKWKDYQQLALALSLVNDSTAPAFWPHRQVAKSLVPKEQRPVTTQFTEWVAANESGGTLLDLKKLSVGQLKFVIDAFVIHDELVWARQNVRLSRALFDRAFPMVFYRTERLKDQKYNWEEDPYLLETILARGGICVDQAYFAMLCGKAKGLPTLFFTGQGRDGGHAWFGYMKSDDHWVLNCGRYDTQNYTIGEALDPQSWRPISDHDLRLLATNFHKKPEFSAAVNDLLMAEIFHKAGNLLLEGRACESAVRTCPRNSVAWVAQGQFLEFSGASVGERKKFHESAEKQFHGNPDVRTFHQKKLAAIAREQGDSMTADNLERLILLQNHRKRSDLSVGVLAGQMQAWIDAGKLDEAGKEFRKQMMSALAQTGGGSLFYDVASPYIMALVGAGKNSDAQEAIRLVRKKLSSQKDSILDIDLRVLEAFASKK